MSRRTSSAIFGIFLLLSQILQGGMAASVPCADDDIAIVDCSGVREECAGAEHFASADSPISHAPIHCKFCDSGACRATHVPALSIALSPITVTIQHSLEAPQPRVEHFRASFDKILRPPR